MARKNNKKKRFAAESEISDWIVSLIRENKLIDAISNIDEIQKHKNIYSQPNFIPSFSIDYVSRLASLKAADYVLDNLGLLEIIAIDKSISIEKGKILRTDIIAFNPQQNTLMVFELKRDIATERQTVTELMGYEQELKNIFLFLGNFDICFVVIAKDWSTLLDHAIGSMNAWSSKQCLALKIEENQDRTKSLKCHIPEAWYLRGSFGVPNDAFQTLDIVLYPSEQHDLSVEEKILSTALDLIARNGDRSNSHGFAILSKIIQPLSKAKWSITICAIDPISMFNWCLVNGLPIRDSEIIKFFRNSANIITQPPPGVPEVYAQALTLLSEIFDTRFESYFPLEQKLQLLKGQTTPIQFEFWGKLGEYSRDFVCNESVRHNLMPYIGRLALDWRYPEVAVPLIGYLTNQWPFAEGRIHCKDLFSFGVAIGVLSAAIALRQAAWMKSIADESEFLMWADLDVLKNVIELNQFYRNTDVKEPPPHLSRVDISSRNDSLQSLVDWIGRNLICDSAIHSKCFELGVQGAPYFSNWIEPSLRDTTNTPMQLQLQSIGHDLLRILVTTLISQESVNCKENLYSLHQLLAPEAHVKDLSSIDFNEVIKNLDSKFLVSNFEKFILPFIDKTIPVVPHRSLPNVNLAIDWDWAKQGIDTLYHEGFSHPAIILRADGTIATGPLTGCMLLLPPVSNRNEEVYFQKETASLSMAVIRKWEDLRMHGI